MESFPEFLQLQRLIDKLGSQARVETPAIVTQRGHSFPLYTITIGSTSPTAPVLGLVGGVHGVEKIGSQVVLSYLEHLLERVHWDESLRWQLERIKIILMPIVNPLGIKFLSRCNANGVDLMRNAPVEAEKATFLVGGQRFSSLLPWYRGDPTRMEVESQVLTDFVKKECFESPLSVVLDVHSGFGIADQLWFPYAKSKSPCPNIAEVSGLKILLDRVLPNHVYKFEPQAMHYTTHGDLWDYLYDEYRTHQGVKAENGESVFFPLTLELGSYNWAKKNPFQLFRFSGHYNPIKPHRMKRTLRRHIPLFDFLTRAVISPMLWKVGPTQQRELFHEQALANWYRQGLHRLLPPPVITKGEE